MSQTKRAFSMIWLIEILKIYEEEQLQTKHLILLKTQNMMDIKEPCFFGL